MSKAWCRAFSNPCRGSGRVGDGCPGVPLSRNPRLPSCAPSGPQLVDRTLCALALSNSEFLSRWASNIESIRGRGGTRGCGRWGLIGKEPSAGRALAWIGSFSTPWGEKVPAGGMRGPPVRTTNRPRPTQPGGRGGGPLCPLRWIFVRRQSCRWADEGLGSARSPCVENAIRKRLAGCSFWLRSIEGELDGPVGLGGDRLETDRTDAE
jgi:hypothetical protein